MRMQGWRQYQKPFRCWYIYADNAGMMARNKMFNHRHPMPEKCRDQGRDGQTFCFLPSFLHIIIPAPTCSFKDFWHCCHPYILIDFIILLYLHLFHCCCFLLYQIFLFLLYVCMFMQLYVYNVINWLFTFRMCVYAAIVYLTSPEPSKNCYNLLILHPILKTLTPL